MALADPVQEAARLMRICNACRYCEGHCAVFPAMELRVAFPERDLRYLANLCHGCGACFHHCQYAPPHEFGVNVPRVFDELRRDTWARHAWPRFLAPLLARSGGASLAAAGVSAVALAAAGALLAGPSALRPHAGAGAFYEVVPHDVLVAVFGAAFLWAGLAMAMAYRSFRREAGDPGEAVPAAAHRRAAADSATLRYLDGGGGGCTYPGERPSAARRRWHHVVFYGFLLCFAATCTAAVLDALGHRAPHPWWSAPVLLGSTGGAGLVAGSIGLLVLRARSDAAPFPRAGMDAAFLALLLLTAVTGFLVLFFRATAAMGVLLLVHLGVVLGLFVTLPYGKFVHALYRYAALARWAVERARPPPAAPPE
ncbi:MAG TPA: tricarballylate utilization 4Fe-4S protein TcuB [Anaeromyxobacter sp.]|nr:tricarballylate utilization 4Fe-4S protein TcuB [Anaeromyxobacter sp.]